MDQEEKKDLCKDDLISEWLSIPDIESDEASDQLKLFDSSDSISDENEVNNDFEAMIEDLRESFHQVEIQACIEEKILNEPSESEMNDAEDAYKRLLNKIIEFGVESLTIDELYNMRSKIYDATSKVIAADKEPLLETVKNSPEIAAEIDKLQVEVALERQKIEDLKKTLEAEKQRNSELANRIQAQSKAVANYINNLKQEQWRSNIVFEDTCERED